MKLGKILNLLFFLFLFSIGSSYSQTLYFCEDVDEDGYPIDESDVFTISTKGSYLDFLVRLDDEVNAREVYYKIYKYEDGDEVYDNTIYQDVKPNWVWFWKQITFYDDGVYNIYVYDEDGNYLASNTLEIEFR